MPVVPVTMVELSAKVSRTLNKTTPGIQIWRIEVGTGAHHWGCLGGVSVREDPPFVSSGP